MSITGSLIGYENNNEVINNKKNRSLFNLTNSSQQCSSLNLSVATANSGGSGVNGGNMVVGGSSIPNDPELTKHSKITISNRFHLNCLWSIWYGILATLLQGHLAIQGIHRFLECSLIAWNKGPPNVELDIQIVLCIFVFIVLPFFLLSALFKIGNLANDGIKLATGNRKCSAETDYELDKEAKGGTWKILWTHSGPTSALLHIILALCLLLPRLFLEARLIDNGVLPKEQIWQTELDFMVTHRERLVILSFMTSPYQNNTNNNKKNSTFYDKKYPSGIYEHTNLIEKFRPNLDDFDNYENSHENLEMKEYFDYATDKTTTSMIEILKTVTTSTLPTTSTTSTSKNSISGKTSLQQLSTTRGNINISNTKNVKATRKIFDESDFDTSYENFNNENNKKSKNNNNNNNKNNKGNKKNQNNRNRNIDENKNNNKNNKINENINEFDIIISTPTKSIETTQKVTKSQNNRNTKQKNTQKPVTVKDSYIHIVRSEKQLETQPTTAQPTTQTTKIINSKIFEIKSTKNNTSKKMQRRSPKFLNDLSIDEDDAIIRNIDSNYNNDIEIFSSDEIDIIQASPLISIKPEKNLTLLTPRKRLNGLGGFLQKFFDVKEIDQRKWSSMPSLEYLNLIFAIMMLTVRYPAVFWGTSKYFASIFSLQMIANGLDILLNYAGISLIYKLQIVGQVLPLQSTTLILNALVTMSLYIFSTILIILSSKVLYLYGHSRLVAKIKERNIISLKITDSWIYFAHCASLCFVLALTVVKAPLMHDLSTVYRGSLDGVVLLSILCSIVHLFLWIVLWLGLSAKRRWSFKIPSNNYITSSANQPLLISPRSTSRDDSSSCQNTTQQTSGENTIYWPKLTPNSPKLKVTFNEVPSTSPLQELLPAEHDGKRNKTHGATICLSSITGETDDGDYATLRGPTDDLLNLNEIYIKSNSINVIGRSLNELGDDNVSEEGKLLECVRDESITYASTRNLEPPVTTYSIVSQQFIEEENLISPLAPVTVTVHSSEIQISTISTPKSIRRGDSGVPNEELTPRSDTTSNESSTSPPDRALSDSSGVHSGEERDEVIIRPRPTASHYKSLVKPPQPVIQEEPFGRSTNMKMSSFNKDALTSATLPLTRGSCDSKPEQYCNTMPLPLGFNQQSRIQQQIYSPSKLIQQQQQLHTTLPNGIRCQHSNQFLRRLPHMKNAESPYGHLGLGSGHHTFSKLLHNPLQNIGISETLSEESDSINYSIIHSTENLNPIRL